MRDEVLGIVAHDLRNPLSMILVEAQLLQRKEPGPERRAGQSAEAIRRAANRMNHLIQDLLDVTRIEAGQLAIQQSRLSAAQVVSEVVDVHSAPAASALIELRPAVSREVPEVWADRDRLFQVFDNLIGNAIKFTPPGGCITVGAAPRDAHVLFWVGDTGPGIAIEDQSRIFDRFWQARLATRTGAGLGLPIVKGIVEAHGGRVWVESAPGRGSTFLFTMPTSRRIDRMTATNPSRDDRLLNGGQQVLGRPDLWNEG
jgi:signal transduction histidine kinase